MKLTRALVLGAGVAAVALVAALGFSSFMVRQAQVWSGEHRALPGFQITAVNAALFISSHTPLVVLFIVTVSFGFMWLLLRARVDKGKHGLVWGVLALAVIAVVVYGYHDFQRAAQRGAVSRYFRSQEYVALRSDLPEGAEGEPRVRISADSDLVTIRVEIRTQEEFDRLVRASQRPGRAQIERLVLVRDGTEYHL